MVSTTDTRSNWHTWSPAYATAPPPACQTLRNYRNTVEWGYTCIFAQEDGDPLPFAINTACMPWITPNIYPSSAAFYSPATVCPTSWTAVSTATTGDQWIAAETGLTCCPVDFAGDGRGGCTPGSSGVFPVVRCGDADAEENERGAFTGMAWPATVTPSINALQMRYRATDVVSADVMTTGAQTPYNSAGSSIGTDGRRTGLSSGAKAAIGTVIPVVFIIGTLAFLLLWRRNKQKKAVGALTARNPGSEKRYQPQRSPDVETPYRHLLDAKHVSSTADGLVGGTYRANSNSHETPEWNVELDGANAECQNLIAANPIDELTSPGNVQEANELSGLARVLRKPLQPIEIDSTPVVVEVGDAYIPYRPGP